MSGIGGIVSLSLAYPLERLKTILSWCQPYTKSSKSECVECNQIQNVAVGASQGHFAYDETSQITIVFTGSLIRQKALLDSICRVKIKNEENPASIILAAYQTQGQNAFTLIDGEFSCAILDGKEKALYFLRSKTGGEDLYWSSTSQAIIFSSSLKGLMSTGQVAASLDLEALSTYLFLGYISQDKTPIQGINRVLPGYCVRISFDGKITIQSFWSFSSCFSRKKMDFANRSDEIFQNLGTLVTNAVADRYEQNMPYPALCGNFLPSQVVQEAFNRGVNHSPLPTIPVQYDSLSLAQRSERASPTFLVTPEKFLNFLVPVTWTNEMPIADTDAITSWHFAEMCHKHNLNPFFDTGFFTAFKIYEKAAEKNIFSKGYTSLRTQFFALLSKLITPFPQIALKALRRTQKEDLHLEYIERESLLSSSELFEASPALHNYFHKDLFIHQFYHLPRIQSEAASFFYLDSKTHVIDKIHTRRYKAARAFQTKPFSPFLDVPLLEFIAGLSNTIWASPDMLHSFPGWFLNKQVEEPKSPDFTNWFSHPSIIALFEALRHGLLVESGYISHNFLDTMVRSRSSHSFQVLYSILTLELWMRLFIDMPLNHSNVEISVSDLLQIPSTL